MMYLDIARMHLRVCGASALLMASFCRRERD